MAQRQRTAAQAPSAVHARGSRCTLCITLSRPGATLAQLGRAAEAIPVYETALRDAPDNTAIARNLARALSVQAQHQEALVRVETLRAVAPEDGETLALIGEEQLALGYDTLAIASLQKALQVSPDNAEALAALRRITSKHTR